MRSLFRDTLIYGIAAAVSRGLSLLVLPIYTRMLAPVDYGALDMITVAASLAMLIVALEIGQALARFHGEVEGTDSRRRMASTALWFAITAYSAVLAVALIYARPLSYWLFGSVMETSFRIGAAFIAMNGVFYLMQNQLRVELRSASYAVLALVYAFTTIGLGLLLGYWLDFGLNGVLCAQLLAATLSVSVGFWLLRRSYGLCLDTGMLRRMLRFSAPLVPSGLATFLTVYANRLLLKDLIGLEAVGLFGVATRLASIITLLIFGLQVAITPLIYAHYREAETPPRLARIFEGVLALALALCLSLGLFADELLAVFASPGYAAAGNLIMPLAPALLFSQLYIFFPGIAISYKMHLQLVIFAITGGASLLFNWLLISEFGLPGAVFATLLVSSLFLIMWIPVSQRFYPLPISWAAVGCLGILFIAAALVGWSERYLDLHIAMSFLVRLILLGIFGGSAFALGLIDIRTLRRLASRHRPDNMA